MGDVYKTAFPNGILQSISEKYLRTPPLNKNKAVVVEPNDIAVIKADVIESDGVASDTDSEKDSDNAQYDEVIEDEGLREEPSTDDYVYDQPIEDRFDEKVEESTKENDDTKGKDARGSKNLNIEDSFYHDEHRSKENSKYGAQFRNWVTNLLAG